MQSDVSFRERSKLIVSLCGFLGKAVCKENSSMDREHFFQNLSEFTQLMEFLSERYWPYIMGRWWMVMLAYNKGCFSFISPTEKPFTHPLSMLFNMSHNYTIICMALVLRIAYL